MSLSGRNGGMTPDQLAVQAVADSMGLRAHPSPSPNPRAPQEVLIVFDSTSGPGVVVGHGTSPEVAWRDACDRLQRLGQIHEGRL